MFSKKYNCIINISAENYINLKKTLIKENLNG